jgi:hypothetical protein
LNKEDFAGLLADIGRPGAAKARARDEPAAEGVVEETFRTEEAERAPPNGPRSFIGAILNGIVVERDAGKSGRNALEHGWINGASRG